MNSLSATLCALGCLLSCLTAVAHRTPNFVAQDDLSDGQHEIRLHYNGVNAKQTSVGHQQGSESGLVLRQVSHHRHLLTLIYVGEVTDHLSVDGLSLRDCELTSEPAEVDNFLNTFSSDVTIAKTTQAGSWSGSLYNVSFAHLDSETQLPDYLRPITHFREQRALCKAHHRKVRKAVKAQRHMERAQRREHQLDSHSRRKRWILNELLILPGTKWCGNDDLAESFNDLDGFVGADACCRKHDSCPLNIGGLETKYGIYNSHLTTVSHCICDERSRRSVLGHLRFPSTKWCGVGYSAQVYGELGAYTRADNCCRQHDLHCPYYVESFQKKYGIMNWSIGTINHCACDERFKACLKMSRTGAADMVGNVFFNVVKTRCFRFEKQKVCRKWSWWGRCQKYAMKNVAVLRDNVPYETS